MKSCEQFPMKTKSLLNRFDRTWIARGVIGRRFGYSVERRQRPPSYGLVIHRAPIT
jgi:hypothetical protein